MQTFQTVKSLAMDQNERKHYDPAIVIIRVVVKVSIHSTMWKESTNRLDDIS